MFQAAAGSCLTAWASPAACSDFARASTTYQSSGQRYQRPSSPPGKVDKNINKNSEPIQRPLSRLVANPKTAAARRQLEDEERLQRLRYGGLTPSEIFYGALLNNVARQAD